MKQFEMIKKSLQGHFSHWNVKHSCHYITPDCRQNCSNACYVAVQTDMLTPDIIKIKTYFKLCIILTIKIGKLKVSQIK